MKIKDIENWNGSKQFEYYVNCFDRSMVLVFNDFEDYNAKELFDNLENNYFKWCDGIEYDTCCEEYLIIHLPMIYSNNLVCVIYEDDEREEDK